QKRQHGDRKERPRCCPKRRLACSAEQPLEWAPQVEPCRDTKHPELAWLAADQNQRGDGVGEVAQGVAPSPEVRLAVAAGVAKILQKECTRRPPWLKVNLRLRDEDES